MRLGAPASQQLFYVVLRIDRSHAKMKMLETSSLKDWAGICNISAERSDSDIDEELENIKQLILSGTEIRLGNRDIAKLGGEILDSFPSTAAGSKSQDCQMYLQTRMDTLLRDNANNILMVNNTVDDNELGGTDLSWKIRILNNPSGFLQMEDKELCLIRWSGTFLPSFGEHWSVQTKDANDLKEHFK